MIRGEKKIKFVNITALYKKQVDWCLKKKKKRIERNYIIVLNACYCENCKNYISTFK